MERVCGTLLQMCQFAIVSALCPKASTVLEQDHFCSDFLCSHETVLTNSQNHEDELSCRSTGKRHPGRLCSQRRTAMLMNISVSGHKGLSDRGNNHEKVPIWQKHLPVDRHRNPRDYQPVGNRWIPMQKKAVKPCFTFFKERFSGSVRS